jgi:polyribonucleotide nucleotidyltransferase
MNKIHEKSFVFTNGKEAFFQTGKLANRCDSAITVKCGNCVMLITVSTDSKNTKSTGDTLALHVDYQEKSYSVAKIPVNNTKRDGKLNEHEILMSRLIDRCIRPTIDSNFNSTISLNIILLSHDQDIFPEMVACFGASLALSLSHVPLKCFFSEVAIYLINDNWVVNPMAASVTDPITKIVVGGSDKNIIMLEGVMVEMKKEKIIEGINIAMEEIKRQCSFQKEFVTSYGDIEKININEQNIEEDKDLTDKIFTVFQKEIKNKNDLDKELCKIKEQYMTHPCK